MISGNFDEVLAISVHTEKSKTEKRNEASVLKEKRRETYKSNILKILMLHAWSTGFSPIEGNLTVRALPTVRIQKAPVHKISKAVG